MHEPWDHLFVLLFAVVWPVYEAVHGYPHFRAQLAAGLLGARAAAYRWSMVFQWSLATGAVILWLLSGRPLADLGLGFSPSLGLLAGAGIAILGIVFLESQRRAVATQAAARELVRKQLGYAEPLLPHDAQEGRLFLALSVTAGICEEILFRGYLMAYLGPWLGVWGALLASSVAFGAAHLYLGPQGALRAGLVGLVFGSLYVLTGSLWIPMLLHALLDRNAGQIARLVLGSPEPPVASARGDAS